ncbi:hypothetical protein [Kaistella faecalis]|uniref:hypothetical protein n=1 Tax=Kaistella faecalis TaxID=2852098 RepID=UPI001C46E847|nr:hypothetical protein [Chryseobacterium faecale]UFK97104.1 hypothetical protein LL667_09005 [Chryseobacterium faecale]
MPSSKQKSSYFYGSMKILHRIFPFLLLVYHLVFAWIGFRYILTNGGDAQRYWFLGQDLAHASWSDFLKPGTDVVKFLTFPLVKFFHLPFWSGFLLFSLISFAGALILYRTLMRIAGSNVKLQVLAMVLMLLPNLHFWTSLIGKEALILIPLTVFCAELSRKRYFSVLLIISVLAVAVIRPHVAFVLALTYVLALLLTFPLSLKRKAMVLGGLAVLTALFAWLLTSLQDFSGGFQRVFQKYEAHIRHFKTTDGYVPLDAYPLPAKLFTFYFRPQPVERSGLFYHVVSTENLVLLLIAGFALWYGLRYFAELRSRLLFVFPLLFMTALGLMYVYAYANYGIIMRTRVMAMPFFAALLVEVFGVAVNEAGASKRGPRQ